MRPMRGRWQEAFLRPHRARAAAGVMRRFAPHLAAHRPSASLWTSPGGAGRRLQALPDGAPAARQLHFGGVPPSIFQTWRGRRPRVFALRRSVRIAIVVALWLGALPHDTGGEASVPEPTDLPTDGSCTPPSCPLCELPPETRRVTLTSDDVYRVGAELSAWNEGQIARIDSIFRAGGLGDPASDGTRKRAHLMTRLATRNAYDYVVRFATDSTCVYEASESTLVHAFGSFSDPGLYPITRLVRARMGLGRVCLRYDLSTDLDTLASLGERPVRIRVRTFEVNRRHQRMLSMMLPTGLDDMVEVLMSQHYACRVERVAHPEPPAFEAYVLDEMEGFLLRKMGVHRPRALLFWQSQGVENGMLPETPVVGVRIYVPQLHLKLPFLPDLGFEDLREIDLPQPILRLDFMHAAHHPEWLGVEPGGFPGWSGHGPVPDPVRERFPDR